MDLTKRGDMYSIGGETGHLDPSPGCPVVGGVLTFCVMHAHQENLRGLSQKSGITTQGWLYLETLSWGVLTNSQEETEFTTRLGSDSGISASFQRQKDPDELRTVGGSWWQSLSENRGVFVKDTSTAGELHAPS